MGAIVYYDDLTLPVERWFLLNQIMIRKIGIGNDIESLKQHYINLAQLVAAKNYEMLQLEVQNMYLNCQAIMTQENWDMELYTLFIKSINNKPVVINDMADLEQAVKKVSNTGVGIFKLKFFELKKKLKINWSYFSRIWMKLKFRKLTSVTS